MKVKPSVDKRVSGYERIQVKSEMLRLMEDVPIAAVMIDSKGQIIVFNYLAEKIFSVKEKAVMGKKLTELFPDVESERLKEFISPSRFGNGQIFKEIFEVIVANRLIFLEASASVFSENGNKRILILFQDITLRIKLLAKENFARSEAEEVAEALRESQETLKIALEAGNMSTWDWRFPATEITRSNILKKIDGLDTGESTLTFEENNKHIHPEDKNRVINSVKNYLKKGSKYAIEYRTVHPGGPVRWIETRGKVIKRDKGEMVRAMGIAMDITKRKIIEQTLRESEEKFRTIFDIVPVVIYELSSEGKLVTLSKAFEKITGWSTEEWIGKPFIDIIHPDDRYMILKKFKEGLKKGITTNAEFKIITKKGGTRILQTESRSRTVEGNQIRRIGIARDVTEDKETEKRFRTQLLVALILANSETIDAAGPSLLEVIGSTFNSELGFIWLEDRREKVMKCRGSWSSDILRFKDFVKENYNHTFTKGENLLGHAWKEGKYLWVSDLEKNKLYVRKEIALKTRLKSVLVFPVKIGREVLGVIEFYSRSSKPIDKEVLKLINSFSFQIAEFIKRREAEDELENSKEQLDAIFRSVPDGILQQNQQGKIIYSNDSAAKVLNFDSTQPMIGSNIKEALSQFEITDKAGRKVRYESLPISTAFKTAKIESQTYKFCHKQGRDDKWILIKSTPIVRKKAEAKMVVTVFDDVTEDIEEQRRREVFMGLVSHEIKNPLASIKAFAELLKRRVPVTKANSEILSYLGSIDMQANKLNKFISDLNDVNKLRAGILKLEIKDFEMNALVERVVQNYQPVAVDNPIKIKKLSRGKIWVKGDEDRIGQVIINLLSNAVKYSDKGKEVEIGVKKDEGWVVVSVKDQGIGISAKNQKEIFKLFKRIENPRTRIMPGLGIGLYIAQAIVWRHGGKIWVHSKEKKGSEFAFSLPTRS